MCLPTLVSRTSNAFLLMEVQYLFTIFIVMYTSCRFVYLLVSRIAALDKFLYHLLISILVMGDYTFFSLDFTYGIASAKSQCLGTWLHSMHRDTAEPSIIKRKGSFYTMTCLFKITLQH